MKKHLLFLLVSLFLFAAPVLAATELTVYTAIEPELMPRYTKAFQEKFPDITIKWVRDSTGPVLARLIAERDAPKADVVFGLALSAALVLEQYDMIEPYTSQGLSLVAPNMQAKDDPNTWSALNAWGGALCVNTRELAKKKLPMPESWNDLTKPEYKNQIVMGSPVSSGISYMTAAGWLQANGEEAGWQFMEALDANVKAYVHSGCKPCQMAAMGEAVIGIASDSCAQVLLERKAPITLVRPREGIAWDIEAAVMLKGSKNPEAAKKLIDFASSQEVAQIALDNNYIPARIDMQTEDNKKTVAQFYPIDNAAAAKTRESTSKKWRDRFERR